MELLIEIMKATPACSFANFVITSHIRRTCSDSRKVTAYDSNDSIISINPIFDPSNLDCMLQIFN